MEHARPLAMAVRRDVWDTYHHRYTHTHTHHYTTLHYTLCVYVCTHTLRYSGGPLVQKLEVCSICKALLDSYTERRKREREHIHKVRSIA